MMGADDKRLQLASILWHEAPEHVEMTRWTEEYVYGLINMHHLLWRLGVLDKPNDLACLLEAQRVRMIQIYRVGNIGTYLLHSTSNYWEFKLG